MIYNIWYTLLIIFSFLTTLIHPKPAASYQCAGQLENFKLIHQSEFLHSVALKETLTQKWKPSLNSQPQCSLTQPGGVDMGLAAGWC